ncbi:ATP-binding cassette domain-containing protein [Amycolatopsis sp.]|uniref:ATP-binding cassette domain-containing protein n=1 Tax=Amycolatopsis sp. TaxID=37632 RepID=UPI002BAA5E7A|nr:ATP-binding cassette domain-containing protein [Amycolatopsis sp.]HVV13669.1 ATP-binding cassette domain-containing protein [Amycolatopsis sp.]
MSLLEISGLTKRYRSVQAVEDVGLTVGEGEVVGLVGESGSGKSTVLRCVLKLVRPDSGSISFAGKDVLRMRGAAARAYRQDVQMVFQDPLGSLNPRMTVEQLVGEGLVVHRRLPDARARRDRVVELLGMVGLRPADLGRFPSSFSGGQLQRIAIARALAVGPRLLVCDEVVSALDVSVQAQVLNLLLDMRDELGLSILFVSHDLAVVNYLCTRVAVLRSGRIVEEGTREQVFGHPRHEYSRELLAAVPDPERVLSARSH